MTEWNAFTVFVGKDDEPVEGQYCVERGELQTQLRIDSDGLKIPATTLPSGFDIPETIVALAELTLGMWASDARR